MSKAQAFIPHATGPILDRLPTTTRGAPGESEVSVRRIRGAAAVRTYQLGVPGTNPVRLIGADAARRTATVKNIGAGDIYVGDRSVSLQTGFRVAIADPPLVLELIGELWAISTGAVETVCVLEETEAGSF